MPSSVGPILFQCNPRRGSRTHSHQMHHSSPFLGGLQFQWIQSCQRVFLSAFSDGLKWEKGSYDCSSPCPTGCVLLSRFEVEIRRRKRALIPSTLVPTYTASVRQYEGVWMIMPKGDFGLFECQFYFVRATVRIICCFRSHPPNWSWYGEGFRKPQFTLLY